MECSEANVKRVKKCLMGKINKEESILECATVKLSICSPQTGKVFRSFDNEGILCVIVDRNKSCLYLKQYELIEFKVVFSIELYTNISEGYTVFGNHFHTIEFPGFFLGLSFPLLDNPNVANRSSLIQKAIISNSKFISIKLDEYVYLHAFDNNKKKKKKYKHKAALDRRLSGNKIKNMKSNISNINNINDKISNELKDNISNNNIDNDNNSSNKLNDNEPESSKKLNINKLESNEMIQENNNVINNNTFDNNTLNNNEGINNNNELMNNNIQDEISSNNNIIEENKSFKKKKETKEEKEKNFFNSIIIEDAPSDKIYKIVQYHLIREKNKVVKKIYKRNFYQFIDPNKISFDNIKYYKINTYDFLNDIFSSSDEEEEQKTFVDYIPSKDIIGDLEDEHIDEEDERLKELMQKKNNLKEIMKKNVNENGVFKTTAAENNY